MRGALRVVVRGAGTVVRHRGWPAYTARMSPHPRSSTMPPDPFLDPASPGGPEQGTSTAVLERTDTSLDEQLQEPGDAERFSHYVRKEKITESAVTGAPVIALCGKVWVPGRDPKKFPVCPVCKEIYDGLRAPQDGDD